MPYHHFHTFYPHSLTPSQIHKLPPSQPHSLAAAYLLHFRLLGEAELVVVLDGAELLVGRLQAAPGDEVHLRNRKKEHVSENISCL